MHKNKILLNIMHLYCIIMQYDTGMIYRCVVIHQPVNYPVRQNVYSGDLQMAWLNLIFH